MTSGEEFRPDWSSAPGDTITDILRERAISEVTFASLMSLSLEQARDLLQGRSTVTIALARDLAGLLGSSVEFWVARDYQYRQDSKRLQADDEGWVRRLPLADMIKLGWLPRQPLPSEELTACLNFFAVSSIAEWRQRYGSLQEVASFRSSTTFDSRHESVAAWLRQGELQAQAIECGPWHSERFHASLDRLRRLTRLKNPAHFIPTLQDTCAENGVAVVVVRSPNGCRASGATRFVTNDRALLQLSFRYLTDDHFWFTFFHEAGHLILHGQKHFFASGLADQSCWILEGADLPETDEEQEANHFAASTLIPPEFQPELLTVPLDTKAIIRLAGRVGVSPGIIVGQLQHYDKIKYDQLNRLKRRFAW